MADDEEEGAFGGLYEDGHWAWDTATEALVFVSDLPPAMTEVIQIPIKAPTGTIEFRDDIDLIEQMRYRRRYQRKIKLDEPDIVTLQDVKDLAIYTAPIGILSPMLINMLHLPSTERFLRALILLCSYYLQITEVMAIRTAELLTKVRTPFCEVFEREFRENLADLRLLVAKEYCIMIIGGGDTKEFHHMGAQKKRRSLSDKDARLYETLLRISVQIVWLALGRRAFHQIELEVSRVFKSEIFNSVEHITKSGYISKMSPLEKSVFFGYCVKHDKKLNTCSPLMNEVFCDRIIDYRLMGLGVIKYPKMTNRLEYLLLALTGPEHIIRDHNVILGIIGMPRSVFDTMLRPVQAPPTTEKSKGSLASSASVSKSVSSNKKSAIGGASKLYPDVVLPIKNDKDIYFPPEFPQDPQPKKRVSEEQRLRWLVRLKKLLYPNR